MYNKTNYKSIYVGSKNCVLLINFRGSKSKDVDPSLKQLVYGTQDGMESLWTPWDELKVRDCLHRSVLESRTLYQVLIKIQIYLIHFYVVQLKSCNQA